MEMTKKKEFQRSSDVSGMKKSDFIGQSDRVETIWLVDKNGGGWKWAWQI